MFIHLYTSMRDLRNIQINGEGRAWNTKKANDVHISFDMDRYSIERVGDGLFSIRKNRHENINVL